VTSVLGGKRTFGPLRHGPMDDALSSAAYDLCIEVRDGAWEAALERVPNGQPAASPEIIDELRRRCPGRETDEYQRAIHRGCSTLAEALALMAGTGGKRSLGALLDSS
jgi:hypothetical protein